MSEPEFYSHGVVQWRCKWCNRIYVSKTNAEKCCKGKVRMKQIVIDNQFYYDSQNLEMKE